ncbi:gamma-mobile-trio protein GmtX [Moritella viscosa]
MINTKRYSKAWQNEYKKKPRPRTTRKKDQWVEDIQDHQTRWLTLDLINENRKLTAENLKYKEVKVLQIDMRKPPLTTGKAIAAREEKKANIEFTASELKSLSHAISEQCFEAFGLSKDSRGRVEQDGQEMFKVGFVSAIEKILDVYAIEEK